MRQGIASAGFAVCASLVLAGAALAQPPAPAAAPPPAAARPQTPTVISPEVQADRKVTFRIYAPQAEAVRLAGSDIPGNGPGAPMT